MQESTCKSDRKCGKGKRNICRSKVGLLSDDVRTQANSLTILQQTDYDGNTYQFLPLTPST